MICEFSAENFCSIRTVQRISFIPNKKMNYGIEDYVLINASDNVKLLKLAVLYGYNASGKTTILEALDYLRSIQIHAHFSKHTETGFEPFAFDEKLKNQVGKFSLSFYIDGILYEYNIALDKNIIYTENLYFTPNKRLTRLFHRKWNSTKKLSEITFSPKLELDGKSKTILLGNCIQNNTVLAAYSRSNVNSTLLDKVFSYFNDSIESLVSLKEKISHRAFNKALNDENSRKLYSILLKKAELQIDNLKVVDQKSDINDKNVLYTENNGDDNFSVTEFKNKNDKDLIFEHKNSFGSFDFFYDKESNGTKKYFGLESIMQDLLYSNHFVSIDEFDTSLHPELISRFLKIFLLNSKKSQLLISINNLYIMDQDYMRPDMIWFCEKIENGSSIFYNAQKFKYHKRISNYKHYREGKFGTIPHYGSAMIEDLNTSDVIN